MGTWQLDEDATLQVFGHLKGYTNTLCCLEATCRTFNRWARDPSLYREIRVLFTRSKMSDAGLSALIDRANTIESLEVQVIRDPEIVVPVESLGDIPPLTTQFMRSFEGTKSQNLRNLVISGLLNLERIHDEYDQHVEYDGDFIASLSSCDSLTHLELAKCSIGMRAVLKLASGKEVSVAGNIVHSWVRFRLSTRTAEQIIQNCPHISTLQIRGCPMSHTAAVTLRDNTNAKDVDILTDVAHFTSGTFAELYERALSESDSD
ncbi:hypothetical protein LIER_08902 [Lithospermum erythrorhizon]|uniref:F-box domain-containing protein n=1 Tax=Lithospermum erythrorhizon TaxID=34254 RepID=A0AAV3PDT4_LITER